MTFQKANNITGWIVFAIALITYWITFEETASYWDCGEFIAVSYKLEVSHPPGAPLFMLVGRVFSFLAMGDVTKVAYWINSLSVIGGAFSILFLFWSITLLGRKLMGTSKLSDITSDQTLVLMGAGAVGALAYTFSDSFWFSAVEAEVYSMSSFFTALVVWMVLKWDVIEDEAKANRWLILLAYMVGLSIGFHLLNLLTLPALGLIYYFKKRPEPTFWGVVLALAISGGLVLFINDFIIPGLPTIAGGFEVFFVNNLGLPFGSGAFVFIVLLVTALVYGIRYSQNSNKPVLNTFILATSFILIGYCSYATIVIRANFDPPINENAPKDVMSFVRYLKREQYGSRPLLYGPYFTAKLIDIKEGDPVYTKGKDKYEITDRKVEYIYEPDQNTILPRAWNPDHKDSYERILGLAEGQKPTFSQNMAYMFQHQIGTMYMRYFMWNFAGRESDEQGADWFKPWDWFQDDVPAAVKENRGRNNYFMIPFLLGLVGMFYQIVKDVKNFSVVGLLFFLLGIAIVIYLNSPPVEPRERDYIYAGSTYAFTFWIGLSVIALSDWLSTLFKRLKPAGIAATIVGLTAPGIMLAEGWDDHDRSDRLYSVDSAKNYLNSCAPNAILFTGGDNDTFPLWYAQEVEGVRTDVRVIVLSYYNTDWYIEQTMRPAYESAPFPYTLSLKQYTQGGPNDYLRFVNNPRIKVLDAREFIQALSKDLPALRGPEGNIVPSRNFALPIDVDHVRSLKIIPPEKDSLLQPVMQWKLNRGLIEKKDLAILDVLVTSNWERPIYFAPTPLSQIYMDLTPYAISEGNASRLLPIRNPNPRKDFVNTAVAYDNMINKFSYRGLDNPKVYYNEDYRGFVLNQRSSLNSLAEALLDEHDMEMAGTTEKIVMEDGLSKLDKAKKVLAFSLEKMPDAAVRYDLTATTQVELLLRAGEKEKALEIANTVGQRADELLTYLIKRRTGLTMELRRNLFIVNDLQRVMYENGFEEMAKKFEDMYEKHAAQLSLDQPY